MSLKWLGALIAVMTLVIGISPARANITDDLMTPEIILDGMTHFESDQGIVDYKVYIRETTEEENGEIVIAELELMFLAPNYKLTLKNDEPKTFSYDASFQMFLSKMDIERLEDVEIRGEECFQIIATPIEFGHKKYTKTYFICKTDYRKMRLISYSANPGYGILKFENDFFYMNFRDDEEIWLLPSRSEVTVTDNRGKVLMTQINDFNRYEFGLGFTIKDFEKILEDYKTYYSEGS